MASDNFNRANESPLASPWIGMPGTGYNPLYLVSNAVRANATSTHGSVHSTAALGTDQYSQHAISSGAATNAYHGPILRQKSDSSQAIVFHSNCSGSGLTYYWYYSSGSYTGRGTATSPGWVNGDVAKGTAVGQAVKLYKNGSLASGHEFTETVVTGDGYGGLGTSGTSSLYLDDWEGGAITSSVGQPTIAGGVGRGIGGGIR